MIAPVRVRIAPSPTGALHLGLVRTALYNWLFARHHGGSFVLRIDDTDPQRNRAEMIAPIQDGLRWLGIDWDEGPDKGGPHAPYFQSERADFHRAAVEQLLAVGAAYWDYATAEEIAAERQQAIESKQGVFRYSRRWMATSEAERRRFEAQGRRGVVRLKMPSNGTLVIDDIVRGRVEFGWQREQDHVVMRSDGTCLYHLASTIDDNAMGITHVIRAEEHLSNTPRQVFILQSLGCPLPQYAHLPYVAEPGTKNKLSKRKVKQYLQNKDFAELVERGNRIATTLGINTDPDLFSPVLVGFYEQIGFLPEALINYIALLGWSWDDRTEWFSRDELIQRFSLERVNRAPASFDPGKLLAFQVRSMMSLSVEERCKLVLPFLVRAGLLAAEPSPQDRAQLASVVAAAGDRIKVAGDILEYTYFFVPDAELTFDADAWNRELSRPSAVERLAKIRPLLATAADFSGPALENLVFEFINREGIKPAQIVHILRLAITGKAIGFGLYDTMAILGKQSVLSRIDLALARARGASND